MQVNKVDGRPTIGKLGSPRERPSRSAFRHKLNRTIRSSKWTVLRWLFRHEIATLQSAFAAESWSRILAVYPDIATKPVRSYLVNGLKWRHRANAIIGHYAATARILTEQGFVDAHTKNVRLVALSTRAGEITVDLGGQQGLYREAELRLVLGLDGCPVVEMGLAVVEKQVLRLVGNGTVLWIGVLKTAVPGEQGLAVSRQLTKAAEGLRPKAFLLLVAQILSRAFGLDGLLAASNKGHVFAGDYSLRHRVKADYGGFWEEAGGQRVNPSMFRLPVVKAQRDPNQYKPNKRPQIRRRHLLEREIERQVHEAIAPLLRDK